MTAHHRRARWSHIDENEDHSDRHVGGGDGSRVLIVDRFDRAARHIDRAGDLVGDHHGDGSNLARGRRTISVHGGTLGSENTCEIHTESPGYTVDIRFPIDYPEQQSLTDFLTQHRDGFVDWVAEATPAFVSL